MNKKLTDEAIQVCINVFDNSTLEEIVNLSSMLGDVWRIGKKMKENVGFEDEFDYDSYNSDFDCEECALSGGACIPGCTQGNAI